MVAAGPLQTFVWLCPRSAASLTHAPQCARSGSLPASSPDSVFAALHSENVPDQGERPILAVDVDGVISLFGFADPADAPGEFLLIDGIAHCISRPAGERLRRLSDWYDLVWATGWEERANEHLPPLLGLEELPYLTFDGRARFGSAHWKLDAIGAHAGERPLAWIEDCIDESCREWADMRDAPTLLVRVESDRGLEAAHTEALIAWVKSGYTP
jgi:hypothetical protein